MWWPAAKNLLEKIFQRIRILDLVDTFIYLAIMRRLFMGHFLLRTSTFSSAKPESDDVDEIGDDFCSSLFGAFSSCGLGFAVTCS